MSRSQLRRWCLWSSLSLGALLCLFSLFYFRQFNWPSELSGQLFLALALPGHFTFIAFLACLPALLVSQVVPSKKLTALLLAVPAIAAAVLIVIDINTFALYRFHLNRMVWELFTGGGAQDIFAFSMLDLALMLGLFIGVSLLAILSIGLGRLLARRARWGWPATGLTLFIMISGQVFYAWADANYYRPVTRQLAVIPWAQPLTAKSFFSKHGLVDVKQQELDLSQSQEGMLNYPKSHFECQTQSAKNLLLIVVDALRADTLSAEAMPTSHALGERGWRFKQHFSTANATRFGVFGMFYGINGSYWFPMLGEQRGPVLIQSMVDHQYEFGIFTSASKVSPEFDRTVFAPIRDRIDLGRTAGDSKAQRDLTITQQWQTFIAQQTDERPFMGMLFYDALHGYDMPEDFDPVFTPQLETVSYMALDNDSDPVPFFNRYKNSARFVDGEISKALKALEQSGLSDDTIVVITSDHGQEFNDSKRNAWGHNSSFSRWQTQVPLIIYNPTATPETFQHTTSHIDIAPTLMRDVLGCTPPLDSYTQGHYLDAEKGHEVLSFTSWSKSAMRVEKAGQVYTSVFTAHDAPRTYDRNYQELPQQSADAQAMAEIMKRRAEFLH